MAIQDDNTILSKADLKEYHNRILPYLGGNMMMSTNNSDYYSTDEKIVGVWIDGKPIYQKTISVTSQPNINAWGSGYEIGASVDTIVKVSGRLVLQNNSGTYVDNVACPTTAHDDYITYVGTDNKHPSLPNHVGVKVGKAGYTSRPVTITVQYTKTTDAANSAAITPGAYDINFPNTWPENTEIYFGNGMYGYRATGSAAITSGTVKSLDAVQITRTANTKIYNYGGTWKRSAAIPAAADTVFGMPLSEDLNINSGVIIGSQGIIFTVKDAFTGTATYDFFVTYTK